MLRAKYEILSVLIKTTKNRPTFFLTQNEKLPSLVQVKTVVLRKSHLINPPISSQANAISDVLLKYE